MKNFSFDVDFTLLRNVFIRYAVMKKDKYTNCPNTKYVKNRELVTIFQLYNIIHKILNLKKIQLYRIIPIFEHM